MATLLRADGAAHEIAPKSPRKGFTLEELYRLLDCQTVETVALADGRTLVLDEDGKGRVPVRARNDAATKLLHEAGGVPWDFVVGDALVVSGRELR